MKTITTNFLVLGLSWGLLASCASSTPFSTSSIREANAPEVAPVNAASVNILEEAPTSSYVKLGEVRLQLNGIRTTRWVQNNPAVRAAIREEAGKLGADTVIDVQILERPMGRRPDQFDMPAPVVDTVVATAIRMKP
ncbi:MAG TPA: hypothetical protein VGQ76_14770 [Thermoanaerobaculia bacterium]|jgi:hypothetical protein|nr:hypothetical protein [Thermoanaerobaculia bacterium]